MTENNQFKFESREHQRKKHIRPGENPPKITAEDGETYIQEMEAFEICATSKCLDTYEDWWEYFEYACAGPSWAYDELQRQKITEPIRTMHIMARTHRGAAAGVVGRKVVVG